MCDSKIEIYTGIANATVIAGQRLYIVVATGRLAPIDYGVGEGNQEARFRGIALNNGSIGQVIKYIGMLRFGPN